MVDRRQAQQDQIARAAAAERGEEPQAEAEAAPQGIEVRIARALRSPSYEYDFGRKHGFGADYEFNAANDFTQHLTEDDANDLRSRRDARFVIKGAE